MLWDRSGNSLDSGYYDLNGISGVSSGEELLDRVGR